MCQQSRAWYKDPLLIFVSSTCCHASCQFDRSGIEPSRMQTQLCVASIFLAGIVAPCFAHVPVSERSFIHCHSCCLSKPILLQTITCTAFLKHWLSSLPVPRPAPVPSRGGSSSAGPERDRSSGGSRVGRAGPPASTALRSDWQGSAGQRRAAAGRAEGRRLGFRMNIHDGADIPPPSPHQSPRHILVIPSVGLPSRRRHRAPRFRRDPVPMSSSHSRSPPPLRHPATPEALPPLPSRPHSRAFLDRPQPPTYAGLSTVISSGHLDNQQRPPARRTVPPLSCRRSLCLFILLHGPVMHAPPAGPPH